MGGQSGRVVVPAPEPSQAFIITNNSGSTVDLLLVGFAKANKRKLLELSIKLAAEPGNFLSVHKQWAGTSEHKKGTVKRVYGVVDGDTVHVPAGEDEGAFLTVLESKPKGSTLQCFAQSVEVPKGKRIIVTPGSAPIAR